MSLALRCLAAAAAILTGGLRAQVVLGPGLDSPSQGFPETRVSVADLDDDGDLDLLSLNGSFTQVRLGDGHGHFGDGLDTEPQLKLQWMDAGDVDGDGRADIVGLQVLAPGKELYVLRGLGGTQFEGPDTYTIPGPTGFGSGALELSDADGDGDLDVLLHTKVADLTGTGTWLYSNDGTGHFTPQPVSSGVTVVTASAADLSADAVADVVETTGLFFASSTLFTRVRLGQPGGGFAIHETWPGSTLCGLSDLDLDGNLDLLTWESGSGGRLQTRLGDGAGGFTDGALTLLPGTEPGNVPTDLDGDGYPDLLLVSNHLDDDFAIRRGDGAGGFEAELCVQFRIEGSVDEFLFADVVPDGRIDIVAAQGNAQSKFVRVLSNLTYPAGGPLLDLGHAQAGALGWPILLLSGDFGPGDPVAFQLAHCVPGSTAVLFVGLAELWVSFHGGTLVPSPDFVLASLVPDALGAALVQAQWPSGLPSGLELTFQCWMALPGDPQAAATSAVRITLP